MNDLFNYVPLYLMSVFFAALKLAGFITWPWWGVAVPAGIGIALFLYLGICGGS